MKEQTTICIDSQVVVAALGASGTISLLIADCLEKLTTLLEVNQVTITTDRLVRRELGPDLSVWSLSYNYP